MGRVDRSYSVRYSGNVKQYWPCAALLALALWLERDLLLEALRIGQDPTKER